MAHSKLRKETNCLSCGAEVPERFCTICGQENVEPKQKFRELALHLVLHTIHFDSRFFSTLKMLFNKPGFLTDEYIKGNRVRFLDPMSMYLFISGFAFLFFLMLQPNHVTYTKANQPEIARIMDSVIANVVVEDKDVKFVKAKNGGIIYVHLWNDKYKHGYKHYDSLQQLLPVDKRDNFIERDWAKREMNAYKLYSQNPYDATRRVRRTSGDNFKKLLFLSMPFFSIFLYYLYYRRRKELYYQSHIIFSLHYYSIVWFFALIDMLSLNVLTASGILVNKTYISLAIFIGLAVYLYKAMRYFYKQGIIITCLKTIVVLVLTIALIMSMGSILAVKSYGYF